MGENLKGSPGRGVRQQPVPPGPGSEKSQKKKGHLRLCKRRAFRALFWSELIKKRTEKHHGPDPQVKNGPALETLSRGDRKWRKEKSFQTSPRCESSSPVWGEPNTRVEGKPRANTRNGKDRRLADGGPAFKRSGETQGVQPQGGKPVLTGNGEGGGGPCPGWKGDG